MERKNNYTSGGKRYNNNFGDDNGTFGKQRNSNNQGYRGGQQN